MQDRMVISVRLIKGVHMIKRFLFLCVFVVISFSSFAKDYTVSQLMSMSPEIFASLTEQEKYPLYDKIFNLIETGDPLDKDFDEYSKYIDKVKTTPAGYENFLKYIGDAAKKKYPSP